eukprot:1178028-Prorocentrum_lima.AAC.1
MRAHSGLRGMSGGELEVQTDTAMEREVPMRRREGLSQFSMRADKRSSIPAGEPAAGPDFRTMRCRRKS